MKNPKKYIRNFAEISINDLIEVGGKNASLGEMIKTLHSKGIRVPDGFAVTASAYWDFVSTNLLSDRIKALLDQLDRSTFENLEIIGEQIRRLILNTPFPKSLNDVIRKGYLELTAKYGSEITLAVRSSATAEDLPDASFAGQQETYLNVKGVENLLQAVHGCYASLFTNRAIKYREDHGFEHTEVALSAGVQLMIRSDLASSGVIFTLDPDSGFRDVILVSSSWGLGENVVQGTVNPDEFYVFKPALNQAKQAIITHKLGSKAKTMIFKENSSGTVNTDTPLEKQEQYSINDEEIYQLANWSDKIEQHYRKPMDIEWAKDGISGQLFIVQARPETIYGQKKKKRIYYKYQLKEKGNVICTGTGLGDKITSGKARLLSSAAEINKLNEGEILVTKITNPDWDPILKKAAAIVTDQGGRTSHAAIVARELGAVAVVGTGNATGKIKDGDIVTVSTGEGETGLIYQGALKWEVTEIDFSKIRLPKTKVMFILGDPDQAFPLSFIPNNGIGLMRLEFIINNAIQIHPMALKKFDQINDATIQRKIEKLTHHYPDKEQYFVTRLAESVAKIAAGFYPKDVIVRMSDFKSNEYASLIGGEQFEPKESNPMLGFRGASRYYHPLYRAGFEMECQAMKIVRNQMGLTNVKLMIPFCRTIKEAEKVLEIMANQGLVRGERNLELYVMIEIPSNILLAEEFAQYFDGFSIGSNDLTQLTLGIDRDSALLTDLFNAQDPAVEEMIRMVINSAHKTQTKIGLCGQAPSDDPSFARFLVQEGIDSISFNPDAIFKGIENIIAAEQRIAEVIV